MNFPLFIAKRIVSEQDDRHKVSRPAITIATAGVAIGLAVMIVTVSVVLGFKHTIRDKVIGFGSHIQVINLMSASTGDTYPIAITDSMMDAIGNIRGIRHVQRFALAQGILKTDEDFLGVNFKGIAQEYDLDFLRQNIVEGTLPAFSDSVSGNNIVVSRIIADKLNINAGERIFAYFIDEDGVRARRFNISAIYQTNMTRFDQTICFTDLHTATKLNGWLPQQYSGAELLVDDFSQLDSTYLRVIAKVNRTSDRYGQSCTSQTIHETYPQIFTWLELLDINVWIILGLMVCLATITMVSGLLIIILERTQMIGTLKALGARNASIRHTFLWFATFILARGLLVGNVLGIGITLLQKYTGLMKLDPQTYYVSEVPMELNIPIVVALNAATLLICVLVLVVPSFFISHIHPAKSMRYE